MNPEVDVIKVDNAADLNRAFDIRREVFINEQACPPELEWEHEEESTHFLALINHVPAGVARWRKTEKGYKLERFAVQAAYRKRGIAQALIQSILADLPSDAKYIYLHAQVQAMPLYAKFGFCKTGPEFEEAGIKHYKMVLTR